ncbi:MAG: BolA family protein, partial [Albidovulum sp.]
GHGGWREGGETHFHIVMRAPALAKMTRIERHRAVHTALGADLVGRIHALSLDLAG